MEINGQEWWVQATGAVVSLTGLYFWMTGWYRLLQERYIPELKKLRKNS